MTEKTKPENPYKHYVRGEKGRAYSKSVKGKKRTTKSRPKGEPKPPKYCECGKEIGAKSKHCRSCSEKINKMTSPQLMHARKHPLRRFTTASADKFADYLNDQTEKGG